MKKNFIILVFLIGNAVVFSQQKIDKPIESSGNLKKEAVTTITNVNCKLKGKINSGKSTYLMLVTEKDNPFKSGVKIPITDGYFEYDLKTAFSEKYTLILGEELENAMFRPISFFAEDGAVEFNLFTGEDFDKNTISGGDLTNKMLAYKNEQKKVFEPIAKPFNEELDSLWESKKYFSEAVNTIMDKIKGHEKDLELNELYRLRDELLETENGYTSRAWFLKSKMDSIQRIKFDWEVKYVKTNQDIFSYSLLLNNVRWYKQNKKTTDLNVLSNVFEIYSKKYPLHPYTKQINEILEGIKTVKVGGMYIDFSAPTIDGKNIIASDIIAGKVALIDLWASWCGPCRVTSKSYIPVYEKYKEKGFVILGVANEFKNTNAFVKAIEKDKYPWLNLIELENKNRIWDKYNISNSGGSTFLIDARGIILAIHPDAEELDKILKGLLN
ncbi:MAG TPA: TlpA disulfide reductase family protein [Flavobacterium sp.]|nr:TlpA disulfide reductase family protein [Flavobacterium sp.]